MKMFRKSVLILLIFISFQTFAQRVYWATEVLDYSSQLSDPEYSAQQVLGKPNAIPQGGDSPNAWMPAKPNKLEYITVSFDKAVKVQQIAIAESYNPSGVYEIYLYNKNGNEFLVHTFEPRAIDLKSRLLRINIKKTKYDVATMRIVIDGRKVPGYCAIDAIGVSSSNKPIEILIDVPQNIRENILVERLGQNVNSEFKETRPLIAPDGKTLYFSRSNHPENLGGKEDENDIWYSELNEQTGEWERSKNIGEPLNNKGSNYISSIAPDGNAMAVLLGNIYGKRDKMKPGVSISTKSTEGWSKPKSLDIINSFIESTEGNYFLASNRKVVIMAIDRYDAFGGKDIYVSFLQKDNKWTEPLNLGNDINSAHTESSPYLAADNETLYFSSKGFSGYGESDVYISRRLDDTWTNWTEPENLGPDINSEGDDIFFNIPPSGKFAYYSRSQRNDNGDIYKIAMPVFYQPSPVVSISGRVVDGSTQQPIVAKISYNLLPENNNVGFTMSDPATGEYEILLPVGSDYEYTASSDGYQRVQASIELLNETDFGEIKRDILMSSGEEAPVVAVVDKTEEKKVEEFISGEEQKLILGSAVLFEFASDYLNEASHSLLDKIAAFMVEKTDVNISIIGHTDNMGPKQYNKSLSKRRAEAVQNYLTSQGVNKSRLMVDGYGFEKPIASNDTQEGRKQNRRVEFSILD